MRRSEAPIRELDWREDAARDGAVEVLASAFRDAPLNRAVIRGGPARRLRVNRHGMRALMATLGGGARAWRAGEPRVRGALIAVAPLCFPLPPPSVAVQLRTVLGQGLATARRWGQVYRALLRLHPEEPHWYLAVVGVDPPDQGRGLGGALLSAFLEQVDRDGAPSYLECDREANLPFYERAGYEVCATTRVEGVPVWCMWRKAK
jgi:GNAT superfamily N-acetyltransferase